MGVPIWSPPVSPRPSKRQRIQDPPARPSSSFLRHTSLRRHNAMYGNSRDAYQALRQARARNLSSTTGAMQQRNERDENQDRLVSQLLQSGGSRHGPQRPREHDRLYYRGQDRDSAHDRLYYHHNHNLHELDLYLDSPHSGASRRSNSHSESRSDLRRLRRPYERQVHFNQPLDNRGDGTTSNGHSLLAPPPPYPHPPAPQEVGGDPVTSAMTMFPFSATYRNHVNNSRPLQNPHGQLYDDFMSLRLLFDTDDEDECRGHDQ